MESRVTIAADADRAVVGQVRSSGRRIQSTGVLEGAPVMGIVADATESLRVYATEPAWTIERDGGAYRVSLSHVCFRVDTVALAEAMPTNSRDWGALACSVMVVEAAWDAGLTDAAIPGILQAFRTGLAMTGSPEQAMLQIRPILNLARTVEAYVGLPDGLAHDRARIAHFAPEALTGRLGNRLLQEMQVDGVKQRELVTAYRGRLDRSLDDAIQAVREARDSGDYAVAVDLLQRFFQVCWDVTAASEWQERLSDLQAARAGSHL